MLANNPSCMRMRGKETAGGEMAREVTFADLPGASGINMLASSRDCH
jgi:hypothetical protein